jgi:hypothetical protein
LVSSVVDTRGKPARPLCCQRKENRLLKVFSKVKVKMTEARTSSTCGWVLNTFQRLGHYDIENETFPDIPSSHMLKRLIGSTPLGQVKASRVPVWAGELQKFRRGFFCTPEGNTSWKDAEWEPQHTCHTDASPDLTALLFDATTQLAKSFAEVRFAKVRPGDETMLGARARRERRARGIGHRRPAASGFIRMPVLHPRNFSFTFWGWHGTQTICLTWNGGDMRRQSEPAEVFLWMGRREEHPWMVRTDRPSDIGTFLTIRADTDMKSLLDVHQTSHNPAALSAGPDHRLTSSATRRAEASIVAPHLLENMQKDGHPVVFKGTVFCATQDESKYPQFAYDRLEKFAATLSFGSSLVEEEIEVGDVHGPLPRNPSGDNVEASCWGPEGLNTVDCAGKEDPISYDSIEAGKGCCLKNAAVLKTQRRRDGRLVVEDSTRSGQCFAYDPADPDSSMLVQAVSMRGKKPTDNEPLTKAQVVTVCSGKKQRKQKRSKRRNRSRSFSMSSASASGIEISS